jgi:hypothetical protein
MQMNTLNEQRRIVELELQQAQYGRCVSRWRCYGWASGRQFNIRIGNDECRVCSNRERLPDLFDRT